MQFTVTNPEWNQEEIRKIEFIILVVQTNELFLNEASGQTTELKEAQTNIAINLFTLEHLTELQRTNAPIATTTFYLFPNIVVSIWGTGWYQSHRGVIANQG